MIRRAAGLIFALTLVPAPLLAQNGVLTVGVPSADVHAGPSTVNPVVGHVPAGTVLPIARNLGSWVQIAWPDAPNGIGYVHVTMGRIGSPTATVPSPTATARGSSTTAPPPVATKTILPMPRTTVAEPVAPRRQRAVTPASHLFGVGGLVASPDTFGASARAWSNKRVGFQFALTRDVTTNDIDATRTTAMQIEPGIVYGIVDHVTDYVWLRPYAGSVMSFRHQTVNLAAPVDPQPPSETGVGFRVFAGTELMFASVPRFGLSADLGYRRYSTTFSGIEPRHLSASIAGHWYVK